MRGTRKWTLRKPSATNTDPTEDPRDESNSESNMSQNSMSESLRALSMRDDEKNVPLDACVPCETGPAAE